MTSTHRGRGFKASIDFADKNRGYGIRKNLINSVDAIYGRTLSFPLFKVDHDRIMRREGEHLKQGPLRRNWASKFRLKVW